MKKNFIPALLLSVVCLILFSGIYTAVIWGIAQLAPNHGEGFVVKTSNGKYYYTDIAQKFTANNYFWPRPSAVDYNANGSGGSNKGPANPDLLKQIQDRIDTFTKHNLGIDKASIPSDMVTASGSGLDPDISIQGADVQVKRVAAARHLPEERIQELVNAHIEKPLLGLFGPEKINVLKLNLALDNLKQ